MLIILSLLASLVAIVCSIIVLVDAFQDELWKGVVGLLCGLYLLYYGIFEYESDNKLLVLLGWLGGGLLAGALQVAARR